MSLARAFTTRRKQSVVSQDTGLVPSRSHTTKGNGASSIRSKISGPVQLVHTTNILSYTAPDLYPTSARTGSPRSEDDISDALTNRSSPPTSPDVPTSPKVESTAVEPNHLSCYFTLPGEPTPSKRADPPVIPQRAPSHTKSPSDGISRKLSLSRMSEHSNRTVSTKNSFSFSRSSSTSTSTSVSPTSPWALKSSSGSPAPQLRNMSPAVSPTSQPPVQYRKDAAAVQHPFGSELAQVSELAEEFGVRDRMSEMDRERKSLVAKGLMTHTAEEYWGEIEGFYAASFADDGAKARPTVAWI